MPRKIAAVQRIDPERLQFEATICAYAMEACADALIAADEDDPPTYPSWAVSDFWAHALKDRAARLRELAQAKREED